MSHLLVTNDFPPKLGGIQAYLWELWRRMDPSTYTVLTASSHPDAARFDAEQAALGIRIDRVRAPVLAPTPALVRRVRALARRQGASLVVLDPAFPLGPMGPALDRLPYAVVLHGAELAAPARLPGTRQVMVATLAWAGLAVCAGRYPADEARRVAGDRLCPVVEVPPGVDVERFHTLPAAARRKARGSFGLPSVGPLVVSVSRLVPRKGMDVLVEAAAALAPSFPGLTVAIAGEGRDRDRIERRVASSGAPVRLLGRIADDRLADLYACADVFALPCRDRWLGLEQEGFGIVFLEAAACGVPQVAGDSGGTADAVAHGETGLVVSDPRDPGQVAAALRRLLTDDALRRRMGRASRRRAERAFAYDRLAPRLAGALAAVEG